MAESPPHPPPTTPEEDNMTQDDPSMQDGEYYMSGALMPQEQQSSQNLEHIQTLQGIDRIRLPRRRSGPATLQTRITRARTLSLPQPSRRWSITSLHRGHRRSASDSTSYSTHYNTDQFIDGRMTPGILNQPPSITRTFQQNPVNGQYEAESTPNAALIDRDRLANIARMRGFVEEMERGTQSQRPDHPDSAEQEGEAGPSTPVVRTLRRTVSRDLSMRDEEHNSAEDLSTHPSQYRQRPLQYPTVVARPKRRDTYPIYRHSDPAVEEEEEEDMEDEYNDAQNNNWDAEREEGVRRPLSHSSSFTHGRTRHSADVGEWINPNQPQHGLNKTLPPLPKLPDTQAYRASPTPPLPEFSSIQMNRGRIPRPHFVEWLDPEDRDAADARHRSARPRRRTRLPARYWCARFWKHLSTQPPDAAPAIHGTDLPTRLEHDAAPSYWPLRGLHLLAWLCIVAFYIYRAATNDKKLAFDCYELMARIRPDTATRTDGGRGGSSTSGATATAAFVASNVEIPAEYHQDGRLGSSICLLTPAVLDTVLFDSFDRRWVVGTMCAGVSNLLMLATFWVLGRVMRKSRAYGKMTLAIRVLASVLCAAAGSATVMGWTGAMLRFREE